MAAAEASLRDGELQVAESHYRSALLEGWLLLGDLEAAEGKLAEARAVVRARLRLRGRDPPRAAVPRPRAPADREKPAEAVRLLTPVVARATPRTPGAAAAGAGPHRGRAARGGGAGAGGGARGRRPTTSSSRSRWPADTCASRRSSRPSASSREIAKARPIPQTHVLIGRTYRDFGEYARARARARRRRSPWTRACGAPTTTSARSASCRKGRPGSSEAIAEFRQELKVSPADPLVEPPPGHRAHGGRRPAEALPALELAARARTRRTPTRSTTWGGPSSRWT